MEIIFLVLVLILMIGSAFFGMKNASLKKELKIEKEISAQQSRMLKSFSKTIEEVHEIYNFNNRVKKAISDKSAVQLNKLYQEAIGKKN